MIKISKVYGGYPSYGPSQGAKSVFIEFEPCEGKLPEGTAQSTPEQTYAKEMLDDLINKIDKANLVDVWSKECLMGTTHIVSVGSEIAAPDNIGIMNEFYYLVGHLAVAMQKDVGLQKMRPPYLVWAGTPKYYTGRKTFFENFQILAVEYPIDGITKDNITEKVPPLAAVEANNHLFSQAYFKIKDIKDFEVIDLYTENQMLELPPIRIFVYDSSESVEKTTAIATEAFKRNLRYFRDDKDTFNAKTLFC